MAVVGINYEEGSRKKDLGYKSVRIAYDNVNKVKIFDSGDFVKDWYRCNEFIAKNLVDSEPFFANSSSVDHFIMDGANFDSMYLTIKDDKPLLYTEYDGNGQEIFVNKGKTPTWEEYKKYCKS